MSFGKRIKALRRNKDMTQEQLAEILAVSPQAVSRWETDSAMPDISLIPAICNLFDTSADHLLGIDSENKKKRVEDIYNNAHAYSRRGYHREARVILEEGMREFPNSFLLIKALMQLAHRQFNTNDGYTADELKAFQDEAISLGERILESCTEDSIRHSAIQILCYMYPKAGNGERAARLAESMPYMSVAREFLIPRIYTGNKQYAANQEKIFDLLQWFVHSVDNMYVKDDAGKMIYTAEENAILRDKLIAILNIVFEKGDFGYFHTLLASIHQGQARFYAKMWDKEKVLSHLQAASEHAIGFIESFKGDKGRHTSLIFRGYGFGTFSTSDSNNTAMQVINEMKRSEYDFIRDNVQFAEIEERMNRYAQKWEIDS